MIELNKIYCADLGRRYIGTDISEEYCKKARERLESEIIK